MTDFLKNAEKCGKAGCQPRSIQRILVLQQDHKAERKIEGITEYGQGEFQLDVASLTSDLPPVIDDGAPYLPRDISADIVLDFLTHSDLSQDLADICAQKKIPVVASGKKINNPWVYAPPT